MPRIKKNVSKQNLSDLEREEFSGVGYADAEIDAFQEKLKAPKWDFWSRASELYLSLSAGSEVIFTSGKVRTVDNVSSAKFNSNFFSTPNREIARLIFMSDPYRDGKVKLVSDQVDDEAQLAYQEFKTKIFSSQQNIERLREDLGKMDPADLPAPSPAVKPGPVRSGAITAR